MKQTKLTVVKAQRPSNVVNLHRNRAYRWHDQDPVMEEILHLIDQSGVPPYQICQMINRMSGGGANIATSTIYNWLKGKVRKPQNYTVTWVGLALGWKREWVKI